MYVCGQNEVIERIDNLVDRNKMPRFSILVAPEGYGKKVVAEYIARKLNAHFVPYPCDVDSVRTAISAAYSNTEKALYMFFDCDNMSVNAKNAMLKVTEEPPNNAYFVMTIQNVSNALGTIISRGTIFYLNEYNQKQLSDYIEWMNYSFSRKTISIINQICTCPKDIQIAKEIDIEEMYALADKFIQLIGQNNIANELKLVTKLSTKKDDKKMNPVLFLRCIMSCCRNYIVDCDVLEDIKAFHTIIAQTSKALKELSTSGSNKQMVLDNYVLRTHMELTDGEL